MKILCFGDSNTYGYDPRDFFGGPYDPTHRWCDLLARQTGWEVINAGENGRTIPASEAALASFGSLLQRHGDAQLLLLLLGTNDAAQGIPIPEICRRIDHLTALSRRQCPELQPVLVEPPPLELPGMADPIPALARGYAALARREDFWFVPTASWQLSLSFDGVHLSEEGHVTFAARLAEALEEKIKLKLVKNENL